MVRFTPWTPLVGQTGVIQSQILFLAFISFIIALRGFECIRRLKGPYEGV